MILQALTDQLQQRFQHEKRAQVCLWFDERQEFARLLPALRHHLEGLEPPPFRLLEYDASQYHGQIWLKHQVNQVHGQPSHGQPSLGQKRQRFVIYLPLPEDRLEHDGAHGEGALELLAEYRHAGITWRLGGKRPTLFSFMKQVGVQLPSAPGDQRRLYDDGRDSLLAQYAAKFADRPAEFWNPLLSSELAQSRLLGDVDQMILDLALEPEPVWRSLEKEGLAAEFLAMVRERYDFAAPDFEGPSHDPERWVEALVLVVALTECYLGYGEPADFPLAERLPALGVRSRHRELLHRWLRDSESRGAWEGWIARVETQVDLAEWAQDKPGFSRGFPHLSRMRWRRIAQSFEAAAPRSSTTAAFFAKHSALIDQESKVAKASLSPTGSWQLLHQLQALVTAAEQATRLAETVDTTAALARLFVEQAAAVDAMHLQVRHEADKQSQPAMIQVADRTYAAYTNRLNSRFFERYVGGADADIPTLPYVTPHLEERLWTTQGRRAVVIVDALRYDCAGLIAQQLQSYEVTLTPLRAALPTVTPMGMTALMPLSGARISCEIQGNSLHPKVNGKDAAARGTRIAFLKDFGADCREIAEIELSPGVPEGLGDLLVVFGHTEVDKIGHGSADALIRHLHLEIERIVRLIHQLHRWGYPRVHVVTDHGFILLDKKKLPETVACDPAWCRLQKERFALVPAEADLPVATLPFVWDPALRVAVPPGLAFFKSPKPFSHGGVALQELVIPHLVSTSRKSTAKRIGVDVVVPTAELMRTAVKVILRPKLPDSSADGQMALFSAGGRTLSLDVLRTEASGERVSVLASGPREIHLEARPSQHQPEPQPEQQVTLFFHTALSFTAGELLHLEVRDAETTQQFPSGGLVLTVGRDM